MTYNPENFSKNLIKGRIAETLFEQMFRDVGKFTILSFGYEKILPELARKQNDIKAEEAMEIIRRAPDFAVIDNQSHEVQLVEVKYLMNPNQDVVFEDAKRMVGSWRPSYLFLATPKGFYFDKALEIFRKKGDMRELDPQVIPTEQQQKYLVLLNEFIQPK